MQLPQPLTPGVLLQRYKRFLADVRLDDGETITAHVANPGAMSGLDAPGLRVWLSQSTNPKRKLPYSWELAELPGGAFVGVNANRPNALVAEALQGRRIPELAAYDVIRPEVRYGVRSRVDFLLSGAGLPDCYLEVKNAHLRRQGDWAEFPDAVTARGAKHLGELAKRAAAGDRAVMLYCVQRDDCAHFRLAADIDPAYAHAHYAARAAGVEILVYACGFGAPPQATVTIERALGLADGADKGA